MKVLAQTTMVRHTVLGCSPYLRANVLNLVSSSYATSSRVGTFGREQQTTGGGRATALRIPGMCSSSRRRWPRSGLWRCLQGSRLFQGSLGAWVRRAATKNRLQKFIDPKPSPAPRRAAARIQRTPKIEALPLQKSEDPTRKRPGGSDMHLCLELALS